MDIAHDGTPTSCDWVNAMIVVIQCAATKRADAGFLKTKDGKPVSFVAKPEMLQRDESRVYARPDDLSDWGASWRERLSAYNDNPDSNPLRLSPAFELYSKDTYRAIVRRFGLQNTYILSAGWGLINAAFLTPYYDITFARAADDYKRRRKSDFYDDYMQMPHDVAGPIVFFGSKEYVPLFAALTCSVSATKKVFYNSKFPPAAPGCLLQRYKTRKKINWQYECAEAFIAGRIVTL